MSREYHLLLLSFFCGVVLSFGQSGLANYQFTGLEYTIGKTSTANVNFPKLNPQQGILLIFGKTHFDGSLPWARQLNYPTTGISFSYVDMGNSRQLGQTISAVPFLDFRVLNRWTNNLNLRVGLGASYFNTTYDEFDNPDNKAITTHFTWAFRSNLYYKILDKPFYDLKLGMGYFHNSNGHTRLPNNGLNTFLFSAVSEFQFHKRPVNFTGTDSLAKPGRSTQKYFCTRIGLGKKVLSKDSTDKKDVYVFSMATGKIINKTFKYGYGFYYRFYEDYYDYIQEEGKLVQELYPEMKSKPAAYASNIGIFANGELLLSHIGVAFDVGLNLYKPFYKIDWQINEQKYVDGAFQLGELNWYYKVKHLISSRLGAKYYLITNNKAPQHNLFVGAFINANLGQADFSELTLGYVYCLPLQKRK